MTLNGDGDAAKARRRVALITIKRSPAGLGTKLISTNRPWTAALWTVYSWSKLHLFVLSLLKPVSFFNLNMVNVLGTN